MQRVSHYSADPSVRPLSHDTGIDYDKEEEEEETEDQGMGWNEQDSFSTHTVRHWFNMPIDLEIHAAHQSLFTLFFYFLWEESGGEKKEFKKKQRGDWDEYVNIQIL